MNNRIIIAASLAAVASSQLGAVGFTPNADDPERGTLTIKFNDKVDKPGGVYQYPDVPREKYDGLLAAESKGTYFGEHIKGADRNNPLYPHTRLAEDEVAAHITFAADEEEQQEAGGAEAAQQQSAQEEQRQAA